MLDNLTRVLCSTENHSIRLGLKEMWWEVGIDVMQKKIHLSSWRYTPNSADIHEKCSNVQCVFFCFDRLCFFAVCRKGQSQYIKGHFSSHNKTYIT